MAYPTFLQGISSVHCTRVYSDYPSGPDKLIRAPIPNASCPFIDHADCPGRVAVARISVDKSNGTKALEMRDLWHRP
jgi:hypothetical protein